MQAGQKGAFSFGIQTTPVRSLKSLDFRQASLQQLWGACQDHLSYAIAYSPTAGGPAAAKPPGERSQQSIGALCVLRITY